MNDRRPVLFYDGVCHLCNGLVKFTVKQDKKGRIRYASLQSKTGQARLIESGLPADDLDTLIYCRSDNCYTRSTAVLKVLRDLGGFWSLFYIFMIIPVCLRDLIYRLVAWMRYKLFGKSDQCILPPAEIRDRFLDV